MKRNQNQNQLKTWLKKAEKVKFTNKSRYDTQFGNKANHERHQENISFETGGFQGKVSYIIRIDLEILDSKKSDLNRLRKCYLEAWLWAVKV